MAWALHTVPGSVREALGHVGRRRTTLLVGGARKSDGTTTATSDVKGGSTVARETLRALRYKHTSTVVMLRAFRFGRTGTNDIVSTSSEPSTSDLQQTESAQADNDLAALSQGLDRNGT